MFEDNSVLQTCHPRILRFYSENPTINFETMNIVLVDFLEKIVLDTNFSQLINQENMTPNVQSQIFMYLKQNSSQMSGITDSIESIKDSINNNNNNIISQIVKSCIDLRNDYIKELRIIVNQETVEHIFPILERNNNQLIDRTTVMINEVVSKNQYPCYQQIQDSIRFFHNSIAEDTTELLRHSQSSNLIDNNNIISEFINHFEIKSNQMIQNIQQPIYSYISSSEERIHSNLANIKDITMKTYGTQEKVCKDLGEYLRTNLVGDLRSPTKLVEQRLTAPLPNSPPTIITPVVSNQPPTIIQRNQINQIISRIFPTSEISKIHKQMNVDTSITLRSSTVLRVHDDTYNHIYMMKRANSPKIIFESKTGETNVSTEEITTFIDLMKQHHTHGVLISHNSGFFSKPNFNIENHDGYLLVYIHFVEYNPDKIKSAVDIVDQLSTKMKQYTNATRNVSEGEHGQCEFIDKNILDEINKEYQLFVSQKETIIQNIRESQRKLVSQLEEFQFPSLDKYLSSKFTAPMPKNGHRCDLCKIFNANNLKALAAHKRGCIRKNGNNENKNIINTETLYPLYSDVSYTNHFVEICQSPLQASLAPDLVVKEAGSPPCHNNVSDSDSIL